MQGWQTLLGIFVIAFVVQLAVPGFTEGLYFDPSNLMPWMFVSSCFLHGGLMHLFFNSFSLLIFGPYLEREIGTKNFLLLFLAAGIAGNLTYYLTIITAIIPVVPALGASGGIFGILGALAMLRPDMRVFVFFIPMPIQAAAALWFVLELMGSFNPGSGIANAAHLGGLILGLAYGMYYERKRKEEFVFQHSGDAGGEWEEDYI
ncbi:rhomboid family intramembrane serine protease [Candidatus Micrarchaeota archaeon]|nr:rhomboid family intramembrane serine protease [Candidatus Micrarchaeota archaeon]